MNDMCAASGCGRPTASKFSNYCDAHKTQLRRHGAVGQIAITKADLQPYAQMVLKRIAANADSPAWAKLEARWSSMGQEASGVVAAYQSGRPGVSWEVLAAQEAVRLAAYIPAREALLTVAAMVLMQELDPRRFRSDAAFRAQLVRRVRFLTEASTTVTQDWRTGKTRTAYREFSPRAVQVLGQWLVEALGMAGLHIARLHREELAAKDAERQSLHDDLEALK